MRRHKHPFNGKRYVLNMSTGEIHDLDNENKNCKIAKISPNNIFNCSSYEEARIYAVMVSNYLKPNGCYYCMPFKNKG